MLDREQMLKALVAHAEGHLAKHQMNVEVYLTNPAGIGEHQDIGTAIEEELAEVADYHDKLEMLNKFFLEPMIKAQQAAQQAQEETDAES